MTNECLKGTLIVIIQVAEVCIVLPVAYCVTFVVIFSLICKRLAKELIVATSITDIAISNLSLYSHNEMMDYVPYWLVWLNGGSLVAAVVYASISVFLALGWQGQKYIVTCGLMVTHYNIATLNRIT